VDLSTLQLISNFVFRFYSVEMASTTKPALKVVLCGDFGVGKSSLFRRFVFDTFVENGGRSSTLGFDHHDKNYHVEGKDITLQLWDTGGLERVATVTSSYFKYADAAILVFSYDALDSFNAVSQHMLEVVSNAEHAKIFLCGNKVDLIEKGLGASAEDVDSFWDQNILTDGGNMFRQLYKVSCKNRQGVHDMFDDIARVLARTCRTEQRPEAEHFQLKREAPKQSCCNGGGSSE